MKQQHTKVKMKAVEAEIVSPPMNPNTTTTPRSPELAQKLEDAYAAVIAEAEILDAIDARRTAMKNLPVRLNLGPGEFTVRSFAKQAGITIDATDKRIKRAYEKGELTRSMVKLVDANGSPTRTYVYKQNPDYIWPDELREKQRIVCRVIDDAVKAARDAEEQAIQSYLEPARPGEWLDQFHDRHERARELYFADHPGAREAHVAREAAGTVVYELKNGRRPSARDVVLAQDFSWGTARLGSSEEMRWLESASEELE